MKKVVRGDRGYYFPEKQKCSRLNMERTVLPLKEEVYVFVIFT